MDSTPRHWRRFSLRSLFVLVTLVAGWCGYQADWIRQRRVFAAAEYDQIESDVYRKWFDSSHVNAPGWLWVFNEDGHSVIHVRVTTPDGAEFSPLDIQRIKEAERLFPEAHTVSLVYEGRGMVSNFTHASARHQ